LGCPARRATREGFGEEIRRRCFRTRPDSGWSERIGHALSAIRDAKLLGELRARGTPLELNPTSNVRTGVCPSFAAHPLRRYFDQGMLVTINSDDPAFFGSDLANEYRLAHTEQGFTREELRQLAANSIRASFLPGPEKARWLNRIETFV
jgi:aminodeoxyfutalosine deaminase